MERAGWFEQAKFALLCKRSYIYPILLKVGFGDYLYRSSPVQNKFTAPTSSDSTIMLLVKASTVSSCRSQNRARTRMTWQVRFQIPFSQSSGAISHFIDRSAQRIYQCYRKKRDENRKVQKIRKDKRKLSLNHRSKAKGREIRRSETVQKVADNEKHHAELGTGCSAS